jgi:hypothetical protein
LLWQKGAPNTVKGGTYWPAIDPLTGNVWVARSTISNGSSARTASSQRGAPGKGPGQPN